MLRVIGCHHHLRSNQKQKKKNKKVHLTTPPKKEEQKPTNELDSINKEQEEQQTQLDSALKQDVFDKQGGEGVSYDEDVIKSDYIIEYAPTGRSSCKGRKPCNGSKIDQGQLQEKHVFFFFWLVGRD